MICPCYSRERRCDDCQRHEDERAADEAKTDLAAEAALFEASAVIFDDPHDDSPQDEADLQREERAADAAKTAARPGAEEIVVTLADAMVASLFAEVAELRARLAGLLAARLPVIVTCADCSKCATVEDDDDWCEHPDANGDHSMGRAVDATRPPPAWCPMRGAK